MICKHHILDTKFSAYLLINQAFLPRLEQLVKTLQTSEMKRRCWRTDSEDSSRGKPISFHSTVSSDQDTIHNQSLCTILNTSLAMSLSFSFEIFRFISLAIHSIFTNFYNCCERCRHNHCWIQILEVRRLHMSPKKAEYKWWIKFHQNMKLFDQHGCEN